MKRLKHIVLILLLGVSIVLPVLSSINPPKAVAATFSGAAGSWWSQASVQERVMAYLFINSMANCIKMGNHGEQLSVNSDISSFRFFTDQTDSSGVIMSSEVNGDANGGDGKLECHGDEGKKWVKAAVDLFGNYGVIASQTEGVGQDGDALSTACWLGWYRFHAQTGKDCISLQGDDRIYVPNDGDAFKKLVTKNLSGTATTAPYTLLGDAERYYLLSQTFLTGCEATNGDKGLYSDAGPTLKSQVDNAGGNDNYYLLDIPQSDGTVETHIFYGNVDRNNNKIISTTSTYDKWNPDCSDIAAEANKYAKNTAIYLQKSGDTNAVPSITGTGGSDTSIDATCGATQGGFFKGLVFWANPLNWLICPLITGMSTLARILDNQIVGMLCINEGDVFDSSAKSSCGNASSTASTTSAGYKSAWNVFRIVALGLLAIAALIMILSQTSGFEIVDAYTIRKTLPRLLIAAIGITLSWALLQFFVGLTNDLGIGVRSLIYAPFNQAVGDGQVVLTGGGGALGKLLASAYLVSLGAFGFLTLLATALLAVIIAFAVLVVRNILVILLLVTAPIAIAAYVLPNTQNIWKTWWGFLSKALMVFPIITAFIAIGHVFAAISVQQNSLFASLIGFAAYFAPYFLLPATFRFAGGALATVGGFANDRSRGVFDGLRNKRKAIQTDRFKRAQNQSLWDEHSFGGIGKYGNKLATWSTDPLSNYALTGIGSKTPGFKKKGAQLGSAIDAAKMEQSGKLFEELNKLYGSNDKAYRALTGQFDGFDTGTQSALKSHFQDKNTGKWRAPESLQDFQKMSEVLSNSESITERTAGSAIGASMGRLATLYADGEMTKANIQSAGLMGLAAHGFASGQDIADTANSLLDSGSSAGFANSVAQQAQVLVSRSRPDAKAGYGTTLENGRFVSGVQAGDGLGDTVLPKKNGKIDTEAIEAERRTNGEVSLDYLGKRGFDVLKSVGPGDIAGAKGGLLKGVEKSGIGDHLRFIVKHGASAEAQGAKARLAAMTDQQKKSAEGQRLAKLADAADLYVPMRDQLLQSASYYSHASSDIKAGAIEILKSGGTEMEALVKQYDATRSAGHDPSAHDGFEDHGGDTPLPGMGGPGGH